MDQSLHRFECLDAAHVLHGFFDDPTDQESPTVPVGGNASPLGDHKGTEFSFFRPLDAERPPAPLISHLPCAISEGQREEMVDFSTRHRAHDKCPLVVKTGGAPGKTTEHPWVSAMRDLEPEVMCSG
jgi:hypothetical protein